MSFPEDTPPNKGILTVGATDADSGSSAEIQYSLFGIGVEDFFMDANTGKRTNTHRHTQTHADTRRHTQTHADTHRHTQTHTEEYVASHFTDQAP